MSKNEETNKPSVKDLREELVKLGMPKKDAELFNHVKPMLATIETLRTAKASEEERVKTLTPKEDPKEVRKINKQWKTKAEIMRAKLDKQPKVRTLIPLSGDEKPGVVKEVMIKGRKELVHVEGAIETVQLNGYKTIIPKGVYIEVPQQVSDVLSNSYRLTQEAGKEYLANRPGNDPTTGLPIKDILTG